MSELPGAWETRTLQCIGLPKTPNVDPSKFPNEIFELYSVPSYTEGKPEIVPGSEIGSVKQVVRPGDVLLCKIVPHIVRVWCVPEAGQYRQIASGEWIVVRPRADEVYNKYIRYALIEPDFRRQFMATVSGVGGSLMRARPKAAAQISIALPPLDEQRRIVVKLDALFARSTRAREELAHVPRLAERTRQAVLAAAFSQLETQQEVLLNSLATFVTSGSRGWAKYYSSEGSLFIRIGNIQRGNIALNLSDIQRVKPPVGAEGERTRIYEADIVITITADLGRIGLVPKEVEEGYVNQHVALIRLIDPRNSTYLAWYLTSELGQYQLQIHNRGMTRAGLGLDDIRAVSLPLPSLPEQREVVRRIEAAFARIDRLAAEARRASAILDRLEQATLARAFRGEL